MPAAKNPPGAEARVQIKVVRLIPLYDNDNIDIIA